MNNFKDYPLMESNKKHINLFYPYISKKSFKSIKKVLSSRWIGQGPLVDKVENNYLVIPTHTKMNLRDASHVSYHIHNILTKNK
ncbi:hypothetical protein OAO90_04200 [Candidatus Pelagibacter ubique]|nr:hypothetical protein [Candidatus Pelagibacter ubique]